jgi:hypothetical protein
MSFGLPFRLSIGSSNLSSMFLDLDGDSDHAYGNTCSLISSFSNWSHLPFRLTTEEVLSNIFQIDIDRSTSQMRQKSLSICQGLALLGLESEQSITGRQYRNLWLGEVAEPCRCSCTQFLWIG